MRALLVEDDAVLAEFVGGGLREAGFVVDHEPNGTAGLAAALHTAYDVAVIDLMLPGRDGLSIIDEMRRRRVTTPVLILSAQAIGRRPRPRPPGGRRRLPDQAVRLSPSCSPACRRWSGARPTRRRRRR